MKDLEITTRSTVINLGLESDAEIGLWVQDNYSNIQTWLSSSDAILLRDWLIEAFPLPPSPSPAMEERNEEKKGGGV